MSDARSSEEQVRLRNPVMTVGQHLVPAWDAQPLIERLKTCRIMLYQHGILTDSERERVDRRIDKKEREMRDMENCDEC